MLKILKHRLHSVIISLANIALVLNKFFTTNVSVDDALTERYQELTQWILDRSKTTIQYYNLRREILFMVKDNTKKKHTLYCLGEPQSVPALNV